MGRCSQPEHTMQRKVLLTVLLLLLAGVGGFFFWKQGTPYQERYWSPNREYYVQKYTNLNVLSWAGGHGSDAAGGYVRLYRKDGVLLHERFVSFSRDVDPVWVGSKVYLRGVADMDRAPWTTPTPNSIELE